MNSHTQKSYQDSLDLLQMFKKATELPLWHIDRLKAEMAIFREYQLAAETEGKLLRKWKISPTNLLLTFTDTMRITSQLLYRLGSRSTIRIKFMSEKAQKLGPNIEACYEPHSREIHSPKKTILLVSLLHEITHHFCIVETSSPYYGHQEEFCKTMETIYEAYATDRIGLKPVKI